MSGLRPQGICHGGTIFDSCRISLQGWFAVAWYMTNQKHRVSVLGLQRLLGLGRYQTA